MNERTVRTLNRLNELFYRERASEFSETRKRPWRGWDELLDRHGASLPSESPLRILDLGCGNGRFATFLSERLERPFRYTGVDASSLALDFARDRTAALEGSRFLLLDVVVENVASHLGDAVFDLVVLFGLLHHVPGIANRERLLRESAELLDDGGLLACTVWRFDRFDRFRRKLVPSDIVVADTGLRLDLRDLEPGDHIMTWGDNETAFRYCHAMSEEEQRSLGKNLPLDRVDDFLADGETDTLNRYFVFRRK